MLFTVQASCHAGDQASKETVQEQSNSKDPRTLELMSARCALLALVLALTCRQAAPFRGPVSRAALDASANPRVAGPLRVVVARHAGRQRGARMPASMTQSSAATGKEAPSREAIEAELADLFASGTVELWRKVSDVEPRGLAVAAVRVP